MTILSFFDDDRRAAPLRDWLAGNWGLVFSHPEDFEDQSLERDRWLEILREAFRAGRVRALACARAGRDAQPGHGAQEGRDAPAGHNTRNWVSELRGDDDTVRSDTVRLAGTRERSGVVDLAACALRETLQRLAGRYVLIVDDALARRGLLHYTAGHINVSPLDLLAAVSLLRRDHGVARPDRALWRAA